MHVCEQYVLFECTKQDLFQDIHKARLGKEEMKIISIPSEPVQPPIRRTNLPSCVCDYIRQKGWNCIINRGDLPLMQGLLLL